LSGAYPGFYKLRRILKQRPHICKVRFAGRRPHGGRQFNVTMLAATS